MWSRTPRPVRALTYARSLGALVIGHPQDPGLSRGMRHQGKFASLRGLPAVRPWPNAWGWTAISGWSR
jgi:dihydroorotase